MEIDKTLDYKKSMLSASEYKMTRLVQNTGGQTVAINNAEYVSEFELPAVALNMARSSLDYNFTIPTQGNGNSSLIFRNTLPIRRLELVSRGGTRVMDISNFAQFLHSTLKQETEIKQYQSSESDIELCVKTGLNDLTPLPASASGDNVPQTIEQQIRLGDIKNCVLSLDKTIMFNEVMNLRVTWAPFTEWGFTDTAANEIDLNAGFNVENLRLHLAQEMNPDVIQGLQAEVMGGGMSVLIPYTYSYKTNVPASQQQTVSLRFNAGHGSRLEKLYHAVYPNDESKHNRYETDIAGKWENGSFYSQLNNKRTTEYDLTPVLAFETRKDYSRGHVIGLSRNIYADSFAWVENWCGSKHDCAVKQHVGGLDLSTEQKWDITFTMNAAVAYNHYSFAVAQKMLTVSSAGITVQ